MRHLFHHHIPGNEVRHLFHHSRSGQWGAAFIPSFTFWALRCGIYFIITFRAMKCGIFSIIHVLGNEVQHSFHHSHSGHLGAAFISSSHSGQWSVASIPSFTFWAMRRGIYSIIYIPGNLRCGIYSIIHIPGSEVRHLFHRSRPGNEVRHLFHQSHSGQWVAAFIPSFTFRAMRLRHLFHHSHFRQWDAAFIPSFTF